ncbi:MAG: FeoA family protein [Chitinivibrionales bacterium]|nr:FeoA family protein [Chitinivibrionales bacterium]
MNGRTRKKLSLCKEGDSARIAGITGSGAFKKRLLEMGIVKGAKLTIIRYAPLRDPMAIEIKGSHLSLRVCEAENIEVEDVSELNSKE